MSEARLFISYYRLQPHPEGGYYKETYRSNEHISSDALPMRFKGERVFATAIYFLLEQGSFSAFHKINSDECWHFYAGQTLLVHIIYPDGELKTVKIGSNIEAGETFQYIVPFNCWFASEPAQGTEYAFVGCTVAPGFDFADFELAKADELSAIFPQHSEIISRLCR